MKKNTLDEDIENVFAYLEFRNSFQMSYVPYTCFKKRIEIRHAIYGIHLILMNNY